MPDVKISALPAATVPLAGTEVLPIVQSATTRQVSVANLTAGRAISASSVTNSALTSGRVTYAGASGLLTDSANLVFTGSNLGVGTSSPATTLEVGGVGKFWTGVSGGLGTVALGDNGTTAYSVGIFRGLANSISSSGNVLNVGGYDGIVFTSSNANLGSQTERMRITSAGLVGISTTNPINPLQVNGAITVSGAYTTLPATSVLTLDYSSGLARYFSLGADASTAGGHAWFGYSSNTGVGSERMRIDSSGNLLVGKTALNSTTTGIQLQSDGTGLFTVNSTSSGVNGLSLVSSSASTYQFYVSMDGVVHAVSATISAISDQRLKENVTDLDVGLNAIMSLKPRKFDWKEGKGKDIKGDRGFIAQEFEQVFPDLIDEWKDSVPEGKEPYKSVRQDLVPVLVKAIQEQQALIESLTTRLTALESK